MNEPKWTVIEGKVNGRRISSRLLEETIQKAVAEGHRHLEVHALGHHGIGGRLWKAGNKSVHVRVLGPSGQRLGSLGFPNTFIEVMGPASDDVGWLNAGAHIVVHGHATNGVANGMAQGKIYIAGNIGARGMTMTKHNPRFSPPELWVLGSVGDYFGEFMAGGIAVVCGVDPQDPENVLGFRPLVGMVGGMVFFRGPHAGYSQVDARMETIDDALWEWLSSNLKEFLHGIGKPELLEGLSRRGEWRLLVARSPQEKASSFRMSVSQFRAEVWDRELGKGGLIGDLVEFDRSPIPLIPTGELRRFVPVWENRRHKSPCENACPSGIPVHERWRLIREGKLDEAVDLALRYTPFPASVCGYLCPNLCMQSCTRQNALMPAVDITLLGKASVSAKSPDLPGLSGKRVAVIGGGPGGISTAWQLRMKGHEAVVFDMADTLGGKLATVIPRTRVPSDVIDAELERARSLLPQVQLEKRLTRAEMAAIRAEYDAVVIATGAQKPRMLPVPGVERAHSALEFLRRARTNDIDCGKNVVVIGAGNVGCDVATEAKRLGAQRITLIDVQEPASFGKERQHAQAAGAIFRYPCFTQAIETDAVVLTTGERIPADTVVISIGDVPDLDFLPEDVKTERGFIVTDADGRTSAADVFAIGDAVRPGLLTDAIGMGRKAAEAIHRMLTRTSESREERSVIDKGRISLEYFDPRIERFEDIDACGSQCASCGTCRDCGVCVAVCPQAAIERVELPTGGYEYRSIDDRCIGCGFCVGACPCGVWNLVENFRME
uniref:Pyridine nucleotide-disulfide oxidoreductase n=1 Tax=Desulfatirhabdium butyrativorans TaxID=340467 RepID=A0A7C4MNR1_9BACT